MAEPLGFNPEDTGGSTGSPKKPRLTDNSIANNAARGINENAEQVVPEPGNGTAPIERNVTNGDIKFTLPDDYDTEQEFVSYAVKCYNDDVTADFLNTQAMVDDQRFLVGYQWDQTEERRRIAAKKPVVTVNRLPAYVGQLIGNRMLNETRIKVLPDFDGKKDKAEVREGIIRDIEMKSRAKDAYDMALQNSLIGGLGNFGVEMDYTAWNVFNQEIKVKRIPNPTAVVWDHLSIEKTGRDASRVFVEDRMAKKDFTTAWPDATMAEFGGDQTYLAQLTATGWMTHDSVRVVSFWRLRHEKRTIILRNDNGAIMDVTDLPPEQWEGLVAMNPQTRIKYQREALKPYAEMYLMTAMNILAGPYRMDTYRVPVFRVPGWEVFVGEERHRFGLIRFAKDPQRIHNYWRSVIVEKLMQTPRAKWTATKEAVQGYENKWRNSHLTDDPLLLWNGDSGQEPKQVQPAQIEPALIQEANMASQDIKDVLNMHEAALGQNGNEVSGKAIQNRQRVSELGSVIYFTNLNDAIEECGRVINDLIPVAYDTARTVRVIGMDDKDKLQRINDPNDPDSVDVMSGNYGITITTGPSYATKRVEAVDGMLQLTQNLPNVMDKAADLIVKEFDWPGADVVSKRLKAALPPNITAAEDDSPEAQQAAQQAKQLDDKMKELALTKAQLDIEEMKAKIRKLQSEATLNDAKGQQAVATAVNQVATAKAADVGSEAAEIQSNIDIATTLHALSQPQPETVPNADAPAS